MELLSNPVVLDILYVIFAFCAGLGSDFFYAEWTKATIDKKPLHATNWTLLSHLVTIACTLMIINDEPYMVGAYVLGACFGTYISVKRN